MSIGMGMPMMDFMIRESRHIVDGPMCIIRLGTCGTPRNDVEVGSVIAVKSSVCVTSDFDALHNNDCHKIPYHISKPVQSDDVTFSLLCSSLKSHVKDYAVVEASDVTTDSFYGSQGRIDTFFNDHNETLIDHIVQVYPDTGSIQMETFQLFHLTKLSKNKIQSGACAIVLAQRRSNKFLDHDSKNKVERMAGMACIDTLLNWEIDKELLMNNNKCVWNKK